MRSSRGLKSTQILGGVDIVEHCLVSDREIDYRPRVGLDQIAPAGVAVQCCQLRKPALAEAHRIALTGLETGDDDAVVRDLFSQRSIGAGGYEGHVCEADQAP